MSTHAAPFFRFTDTFTGTNGANINPSEWSTAEGSSPCTINTNQCHSPASPSLFGDIQIVKHCYSGNMGVTWVATTIADGVIGDGALLRYAIGGKGQRILGVVATSGGDIRVVGFNDTDGADILDGWSGVVNGDTIRAEVIGMNVKMWVNGTLRIDHIIVNPNYIDLTDGQPGIYTGPTGGAVIDSYSTYSINSSRQLSRIGARRKA